MQFKTAWWLGSATDNNMGTVAYNNSFAQIAAGMTPDGWADEGWFNLLEGGQNFILDGVPGGHEVLLRSIDLMTQSRSKALVWQAGIRTQGAPKGSKAGSLIVCGLNVLQNPFTTGSKGAKVPEAAWMLRSLIKYAASGPQPGKQLTVKVTECPGCFPPVNVNICNGTTTT